MRGGGIHRCDARERKATPGASSHPGRNDTADATATARERDASRSGARWPVARPWAYPLACTAISEQLFLAKTVALLGSTSGRVGPSSRVAGLGQQLISTVVAWVQRHSWCHLHLDAF